jgi:hypothetical protein
MGKQNDHTVSNLCYLRQAKTDEECRALMAKKRILDVAGVFSGSTNYQGMIDKFLTRVANRTSEILAEKGMAHPLIRKMVEDYVEAEITRVIAQIEETAERRLAPRKNGDGHDRPVQTA